MNVRSTRASLAVIAAVLVACTGTQPSPPASGPAPSPSVASASASAEAVPESRVPAPTANAPAEQAGSMLRVQAAGVRMRSEPSASGALLATLPAGATVVRTDATAVEADDLAWYEVRFGETTGWVAAGPESDWLASVTNGRIGFACTHCGDGDSRATVTVEPDGSDLQILLSAFGSPTWSPDGTQVVIESEAGEFERRITLMAADGSDATPLGEGSGAAWSPDGEWLAFSNHSAGTLVVMDPDGRRFDLTVNDYGAPDALAWSPDSAMLALVAIDCDGCPTDEPLMGDVPRGIYLFTPPMGSVDRVVEGGFYGQPMWSPDGRSLTYFATDLSTVQEVRRLDIADGTVTTLISGDSPLLSGALSPDGARLTALTPDGIVVADADGGDQRMLVPRTDDTNPTPTNPRWSPDGRWILFDKFWVTGDLVETWIVRADGSGEPQRVSENAYGAAWQPVLVPLGN
jgi:dipeptidyl aminopeptidase/acylaminoacyl peptidase